MTIPSPPILYCNYITEYSLILILKTYYVIKLCITILWYGINYRRFFLQVHLKLSIQIYRFSIIPI